jgi:hypothetical protein
MPRFSISLLHLASLHVACVAACFGGPPGDTDAGDAGDASTSDAPPNVMPTCSGTSPSFATDVTPILNSCSGELCHGGTMASIWPYNSLVNVPASRNPCSGAGMLVVPNSVDQSYLMKKLMGIQMCTGTSRMPIGTPLSASQVQTITDWICQGAPDN